jgi:LysR family transcriptional regulator, hydrogen peroxide-inducible genes activator
LSMVCEGLGVSVVPAMAVEKRAGCCFIPLSDARAERTIGAVTLKGRSLTRASAQFLEHLGVKPSKNGNSGAQAEFRVIAGA